MTRLYHGHVRPGGGHFGDSVVVTDVGVERG